jgi:hypothetical protein
VFHDPHVDRQLEHPDALATLLPGFPRPRLDVAVALGFLLLVVVLGGDGLLLGGRGARLLGDVAFIILPVASPAGPLFGFGVGEIILVLLFLICDVSLQGLLLKFC